MQTQQMFDMLEVSRHGLTNNLEDLGKKKWNSCWRKCIKVIGGHIASTVHEDHIVG
jgi:hypothetical protein